MLTSQCLSMLILLMLVLLMFVFSYTVYVTVILGYAVIAWSQLL